MAFKNICKRENLSAPSAVRFVGISLLMILAALLPVSLPPASAAGSTGYQAKMVTTVGKHSNQSELLVKGRKMKLKVLNGRTFSTMITDYDRKVLWMLAPIGRQYMEYDLSAMGRSVPQFFHPEVKINKKKIAKEMVGDRKAIKYAAEVTSPGSARVFDGFLWIAESLPDYPLKWQDPEYQLTVDWQDAKLVELDDSLFALPEGYLKVEPPKPGADVAGHQGQHRPESTAAEKKD